MMYILYFCIAIFAIVTTKYAVPFILSTAKIPHHLVTTVNFFLNIAVSLSTFFILFFLLHVLGIVNTTDEITGEQHETASHRFKSIDEKKSIIIKEEEQLAEEKKERERKEQELLRELEAEKERRLAEEKKERERKEQELLRALEAEKERRIELEKERRLAEEKKERERKEQERLKVGRRKRTSC